MLYNMSNKKNRNHTVSAKPGSNSKNPASARPSYANVARGGTHNLRRRSNEQQGGSMSSNSGGSHGSTDTRNNRRDRDREQGSSSHQQSGQPQGGSMSSNSGPRPSTSGGSQGSFDTRNKPDENVSYNFFFLLNVSYIFYWSENDFRSVGS